MTETYDYETAVEFVRDVQCAWETAVAGDACAGMVYEISAVLMEHGIDSDRAYAFASRIAAADVRTWAGAVIEEFLPQHLDTYRAEVE